MKILDDNELFTAIVTRCYNSRKVNSTKEDFAKELKVIFSYMDFYNTIDEETDSILDDRGNVKSLDNIYILNEFKDWIYPLSIRYNPSDRKTVDLLIRDEFDEKFKFKYSDYLDACARFRGLFKSSIESNQNMTALSTLRMHKSLSEVLNQMMVRLNDSANSPMVVVYQGGPFIPIPVRSVVRGLFREDYFNSTSNNVINDYLDDVMKF